MLPLEHEVNVGGGGGWEAGFVVIFVVWGLWTQPKDARLFLSLGAA